MVTQQQDSFVAYVASLEGDLVQELGIRESLAKDCIALILEKIQSEYGASRPYVHGANRSSRHKAVMNIYAETHWSISKIAQHFDMSERQVYRIIKDSN